MSKKLDDLLAAMNESLGDRKLEDIGMKDKYWDHRDAYMKALHEADGVHVPFVSSSAAVTETEAVEENLEAKSALEQLKSIGVH